MVSFHFIDFTHYMLPTNPIFEYPFAHFMVKMAWLVDFHTSIFMIV